MKANYHKTIDFIKRDWHSHPIRLCFETLNWLLSFGVAMTFTLTVPNVPLMLVYPMFLTSLCIGMYSALSRGSFGLFATALTMFIIDVIGYIKLLAI